MGLPVVELAMAEVGFEDGSVLRSGRLFLPDPKTLVIPQRKSRPVGRFALTVTNLDISATASTVERPVTSFVRAVKPK
jgi:hypothetical protein